MRQARWLKRMGARNQPREIWIKSLWTVCHFSVTLDKVIPRKKSFQVLKCTQHGISKRNWIPMKMAQKECRSSSRGVRIRVSFLPVVYVSRGPLPQKRNGKRELLGDLCADGCEIRDRTILTPWESSVLVFTGDHHFRGFRWCRISSIQSISLLAL